MRKLLLLATIFCIPAVCQAAFPTRTVMISTNTITRQLGTSVIQGLNVSTTTVSSNTVTNQTVINQTVTLSTFTSINTATFIPSLPISSATVNSITIGTTTISGAVRSSLQAPTSGQFLISAGPSLPPFFSFSGRILQIQSSSTVNNQKTTTSGTFTDTGLQKSITPIASNSMLFILIYQSISATGVAGTECEMRITRDSSDISSNGDQISFMGESASEEGATISMWATDSPGAGTFLYKTRHARFAGTGTCIANSTAGTNTGNGGGIIIFEVGQ